MRSVLVVLVSIGLVLLAETRASCMSRSTQLCSGARRAMWRLACGALLAMGMAALSAPTAAQGQALAARSDAEQAARALPSDNVYTDPDAERGLNSSEERRLQSAIAAADGGPVYVAVVPAAALGEAGGNVGALARQIGTSVRRPGTYVVVAGDQIGAASSVLRPGTARELAEQAAANSGGGPVSVLEDFVRRLGEARRSGGRVGDDRGGGGIGGLGLLAAIGAILAAAVGLSRRRRRREERARVAEVKETAWDDLVALGDEIRATELDVDMPNAPPDAKEHYGHAVESYQRAERAYQSARRPDDLEAMTSALEEGSFAITAARARLEGREPPERRPPCFFDPRHGPSVRDVEWAPPDGAVRTVPACAADAVRVEDGQEPAAREVTVGGQRVPYWHAPPYYGPWAGGFFGGLGGGLLPGLFLGSMLGSGLGLGMGYGDAWGDPGVGDFGGGDFGGGDFGGGGFGGDGDF